MDATLTGSDVLKDLIYIDIVWISFRTTSWEIVGVRWEFEILSSRSKQSSMLASDAYNSDYKICCTIVSKSYWVTG